MSRISVAKLPMKEELTTTLMIKAMNLLEARDKKKYLGITLADASGEVDARLWQEAESVYHSLGTGDVVVVQGRVNIFQGRKQFVISQIEKTEDFVIEDFMQAAKESPEKMLTKLNELVSSLDDYYIRTLLENVLADKEISRRLKTWQAGKSIHHAYLSGLLEHILSCSELAIQLAPRYEVNTSYVVAGAVLHDLCKVYELTDGMSVEYTEEGKLVGHLVKGVELVDRFSYKIPNFPRAMKQHLKHILLAHHGEYEYGSPKIPQTQEAMLVHLIDLMDSKMHSFKTAIRQDNNSGRWTGYIKHLDRIIYKEELPTFNAPIHNEEKDEEKAASSKAKDKQAAKDKPKHQPRHQKELKQNLGSLLKDFPTSNGND